jgi:predicted lipoprotein with Yx(FWY)xxD motif
MAAAAAAFAILSAGRAAAQEPKTPPGITAHVVETGKTVFVDSKMMTLYTYARDTVTGKSLCNARCAENWPPLKAPDDAKPIGDWTIVTRDDGAKMWAYKGKPLYTYARDAKPGDMTGDNAGNGNWHVATP